MNIVVCMKQILDPEVPARDFRIDPARKEAERGSASLVTNIFCENALETALQFGGTITALSYGPDSAEDTLRKALAMKANAAALVAGDGGHPLHVAQVLAAAIRKLGPFDLVITGRESGDWGAAQTGGLLAEELGLPCVSFVDTIELGSGQRAAGGGQEEEPASADLLPAARSSPPASPVLRLKRQTEAGWEIVEAQPPLVVTITNAEHNVPRIPKVRDVMMAHRQPLTRFTVDELGVAPSEYYDVVELAIPQKESRCEFVDVDEFAKRITELTAAL